MASFPLRWKNDQVKAKAKKLADAQGISINDFMNNLVINYDMHNDIKEIKKKTNEIHRDLTKDHL